MKQLIDGTIDLLSYQQAIGGQIFSLQSSTKDLDTEDEPLRSSKRTDRIEIPDLNDIVAPLPLAATQIVPGRRGTRLWSDL